MKKIIWTGLVAGIAMAVVNMLLNPLIYALFPGLQEAYMTPVFRPWDDPLMMLFFLYPIVLGLALAYVWDRIKKLCHHTPWRAGINFGIIFFLVSGLPTFLINYSSFNLPLEMILSWTFMSAVNGFVAGLTLAYLNKNK